MHSCPGCKIIFSYDPEYKCQQFWKNGRTLCRACYQKHKDLMEKNRIKRRKETAERKAEKELYEKFLEKMNERNGPFDEAKRILKDLLYSVAQEVEDNLYSGKDGQK